MNWESNDLWPSSQG